MSHAPFPHVFISVNQPIQHVVNDKPLKVGDEYYSHLAVTNSGDPVKIFRKVTEIIEQRPAKGNWNGWLVHPIWHAIKFEKSATTF